MNRKTARENAFLLLFEDAARKNDDAEEIYTLATEERELETDDYVKRVFFGVREHREEIDAVIGDCLVGWKRERVSTASTAILRLGVYELMFCEDIPAKVTINEGIELSKKFDDENAYIFVNGVLNAAADKLGKKE